ncbi:MAG: ATP synthase F1 subunit delta [Nitriliruptoraceae bacterium]|nr:ATP synthase F1 subunit delta [Nitriliruptoraceae bacterium]
MPNDRIRRYAEAIVAIATGEGGLDAVEDELLTLARAIDGSEELRSKLSDRHLPVGQRLTFVESQVLTAAHPATRTALATLIAAELAGELSAVAATVADLAAHSRDEEFAEVYVAAPIDDARKAALKAALERATGKTLDLQVIVDESLVGGVRARIGDTVIDGSLMRRLDDLRGRIGA